eukprot:COSAG02_NODE_19547_length_876_cov_3.776410_1_plen_25_part_10
MQVQEIRIKQDAYPIGSGYEATFCA